MTTFLLNSGHGADTVGKRSPFVPPGIIEYEFNKSIVEKIIVMAESENIAVEYLNPEINSVPLKEIVKRANDFYSKNSDCIFISVHANAAPGGEKCWVNNASGVTVFVAKDSSNYEYLFASLIADAVSKHGSLKNRGVKKKNLYVVRKVKAPAVLVENGFMTNYGEAIKLATEGWRNKIAEAYINTMKAWLENRRVTNKTFDLVLFNRVCCT